MGHPDQKRGILCAVAAHTLWGLFPIYWHQIENADSTELVCHRIVWSFVSLAIVIPFLLRRGWWGGTRLVWTSLQSPRTWAVYAIAAVMIGINWLAFIWAVNHGRVLEASLGYYINPLFNVVLGVAVFSERLGKIQWTAVGLATIGVGIMATGSGGLPWVSLVMATSFAMYALVKKLASLPILVGLMLEVTILFLPAVFYLGNRFAGGVSAMQTGPPYVTWMLLAAGLVTVAPLAFFAAAVKRVNLSLIGILQYIGPTLQFLVGAFLYDEVLDPTRKVGFVFVWVALLVFLAGPRLWGYRREASVTA